MKDETVFAVLYNTGKTIERIPFKEERCDLDTLYKVDIANTPGMGFEGDLFGKISNCPISMVAAKDK